MTNHEKYKQAFDCLTTDAEINLNPASIRRSRTTRVVRRMCYTAACLVMMFAASNGICYTATGKSLVHTIIVMADGSNVEISEDDNSVTFTIEKTGDLSYTTAENGRLYLNLNDEKTDITDQCSDTDYFRKDYTDSEGNKHVLIAGGTVESYGWAEDIFNAAGKYIFTVEKFLFHCLETFVSISENSFFVWLQFILCLLLPKNKI